MSSIQDSISVFEESVISNEEISDSKPTLINVWFQECESCSYLKELNAKYSNNEIDIINILVVDNHRDQMYYDYIEYLEGVSYYLKSLDFPFPVYEQEKNISVFGSIKNFFNDRQEKSYSLLINDNFIIEKFAGYDDETKIKIDKAINKVLNNEEDVESDPRFYPPFLAVKHLKQAKEKINNTKSDFVRELDTKYALKLFKQGYDLIHDYGLEFADSATFYHIKEGFRFGKRGNIEDSYANINTTKWRNLRDKLIELKELPSLKTLEEDLFDTSLVKSDYIFKAATLLYKGFNNTELSKKYYEIYAKRFFDGNDIENVYLALKNIDFNNREKWDSLYIEKIKLDFSEYEKLNYNRANDIMAVVKKRQQPKDLVASYTVKYKEFEYQINRLYISEGQKQLVTIYNSFDYYSFNNKPYVSSKEDFKDSLYLLYGVRPHHITRATLNYDSKSIPFRTNEEVDYNKLSPSLPFIYGSNIYYAEFLYRSKKDYRFRLNKNIDECEYKGKKYSCFEIESYPKNDIIIPENAIDVFQSMSHYEWDDEKWGRHSSFEIGKHITKIIEVNDNILIPIEDITLNFGLDTMIVKEIEYEDIGGIYYLPNQIKISYKDDKDNLYIDLDKYSINNSLDEYANLFFLNNISNKSKKDDDEDKYVRVQRLRYKSDQRQQRRKNPFTYISDEPEWIDNFIGLNEVGFEEYSDIDINKIDEQIQHIEQLYYDLFDETFIIPEPEEHEDYTRKSSDPNYVHDILQGNSYFIGNDSAPITITKFFDFQCPYCAKSRGIIEDILYEYPEDVKIVFKSFPLGSHKQAFKTAKYALAAGRQGKFYEMYSKIFENDNWRNLKFDENLPKTFAVELGLDIDQLEKDMNDPALENQINAEYNQLKSLGNSYDTEQYKGVRLAVPKFFINGREPSSRTIQAWSKIIEEELCDLDSLEINYYSDGSKRYEIQIEDCKREGIAEYWDELGNLSKTVEFKNGKLNGEKNTYYPSGKIKETSTYKNDKLNGTLIKYDVDGDTIQTVTYKNNDIILPGYVIFSINNAATSYVQSTKQYFYFVDDALINGEELISSDWIIAYNNSTIVGARQYTKDNTDVPIMGFDSLTESLKIATEGYCEIGDIPIIQVYRSNGNIVEMNVTVTEGDLEFKGIGHARVTLNGTIED